MSLFRKKKPNKSAIRTWKLRMESLSESERDFVILLLDGGRTGSQLRRRGFNPQEMATIVARKGFKVMANKNFDPMFTIIKEF